MLLVVLKPVHGPGGEEVLQTSLEPLDDGLSPYAREDLLDEELVVPLRLQLHAPQDPLFVGRFRVEPEVLQAVVLGAVGEVEEEGDAEAGGDSPGVVALVDRGVVEEDGERLRPVLLPQLLEEVADVLPLVAPADEELVVDDSLPGGGPHHLGDVLASAGSGLELRSHRAR